MTDALLFSISEAWADVYGSMPEDCTVGGFGGPLLPSKETVLVSVHAFTAEYHRSVQRRCEFLQVLPDSAVVAV